MKRALLRGVLLHAGGSAAAAGVGLVRNVLIARVMGPAAFGLWQGCLVALRLAGECHLGALHALALDGPLLRAAGREEEARLLERRALSVSLLLSLPPALAAAAILRWAGGEGLGLAAVLLAGTVVVWQVYQAESAVLRTRGRFGTLSLLQWIFAAAHLAALLLLVPGHYLTGALAACIAGAGIALPAAALVAHRGLPLPLPPAGLASAALLRRGGATWLAGVTFLLLFQVDRIAVGLLLGREALGHYGILNLGGAALLFLPDVFAGVLWPLAGERYGRSGERPDSLGRVAEEGIRGLGRVLACLLLLGLQGIDLLVRVLLPAYQEALLPLRAYLPGVYLLCLTIPARTLLVTAGRERRILGAQAAVLLLSAAAEIAAAAGGGGILGVGVAFTGGALLLLVLLLREAAGVLRTDRGWPALADRGDRAVRCTDGAG